MSEHISNKAIRLVKSWVVYTALIFLTLSFAQPIQTLAADEIKIIPNLQAPDSPSNLLQMTADNTKPISTGGAVNNGQFVVRSLIRDPDPQDSLVVEIEIRSVGVGFTGQPNYASPTITTAGPAMIIPILISGLPEGQYHWQERVKDAAGHFSSWVTYGGNDELLTDLVVDQTPPAPPTQVVVTGGVKSVVINWLPSLSNDVVLVDVLRGRTADQVNAVVAQISAGQTNYTDSGLQAGVIYWYSLRVKDAAGNVSSATTPVGIMTDLILDDSDSGHVTFNGVWAEVTNLSSDLASGGTFHWAPGDSGASVVYSPKLLSPGRYEILVSWLVNPPNLVGKQATNAPYIIGDAEGERLVFVDQSKLANGAETTTPTWSGWYSIGVATTTQDRSLSVMLKALANGYVNTDASRFVYVRPLPPIGLQVIDRPQDDGGVIDLTWLPSPTPTVNRYRIYRSTTAGGYDLTKPLAEVAVLTYSDATATTGQVYFYTVTAFDGTRESIRSVEQQGTSIDQLPPPRPKELNITDGDGLLALSWPAVADASSYEILVKNASSGEVVSKMVLPSSETSTKIINLTNDQLYTVDLVAIDSSANRSPFIGVIGQPKIPQLPSQPVTQEISRPVAVKAAMTQKVSRPQLEAKPPTKIEQPSEPVVEVKKGEDEGEVKGTKDEEPTPNRLLITLLILIIAIIVGIGGYYGYDWWVGGDQGVPSKKDHQPDQSVQDNTQPIDQLPPVGPPADKPDQPDQEPSAQDDQSSRPTKRW